jgi:hypothetical protein
MLLKWINSKIVTVSLYKKIKIKPLESFVKEIEKMANQRVTKLQ